jgi:hypothetical protein
MYNEERDYITSHRARKARPKAQSKFDRFLLQAAPILFFATVMLGGSFRTPMIIDEYTFYKLANNFPDYSSTPAWFFEDRPEILFNSIDWDAIDADQREMFNIVYDTPIYTHTPLTVILVSPAVKGLNYLASKGVINYLEDDPGLVRQEDGTLKASRAETITLILRLIPITLCSLSLWLIFKTMQHKVGTNPYLFAVPVTFGLIMLTGAFLFYWDVFMMFFFALTLYLMEVKPNSKWKYVTACCLVNTKMFIGIAFLAPLVIKAIKNNWKTSYKMILPVLSILPFYITTVIVTGEPFYIFTHYLAQTPIHNMVYEQFTIATFFSTLFSLGIPIILTLTVPVFWYWKKYPEYAFFLIIAVVYAWGTGLGVTHTSTMIYTGVLVFPLVAHELRLVERLRSLAATAKARA